ncbi:MAG: tetratricopeptide repeat protein [bacterium]|nr:tetratricopeptide repeat protein [bacterium]
MIYIVALLLMVAIVFETLLLRKGLKSAKKNAAHLRSKQAAPQSSRSNKRVKTSSTDPLPEAPTVEELVSKISGNFQNMVEFPDKESVHRENRLSDGLRNASDPAAQEQSVHDMIQEIRGGKLMPEAGTEVAAKIDAKDDNSDDYEELVEYEELPAGDEAEAEEFENSAENGGPPLDATIEDDELSAEIPGNDAAFAAEGGEFEMPENLEEAEIIPSPEELLKSGIRCVRQGKLDEGIAALEQAVASAPRKAEAHFNLGIAYTLQEFHASAVRSYQKAIELDPQYGKAFFNLGTLFLKQGHVKEAIDKLERAVRFLKDPMKALWNLYEAYRSSELFSKALSTLERLIALEPDDASLHNHLGICYVKLRKYPEAIDAWKRSVSLGASSRLIFYNLGKTYELCGKTDEATEQYERFLQLNSNSSDWAELMEEVQERLESLQETLHP